MDQSIHKMAIMSPSRKEISQGMWGNTSVLWIEDFHGKIGEIMTQERHYRDRNAYRHEALLQKAICVLHPTSWDVLTSQSSDKASILITWSGNKNFEQVVQEKTSGLEKDITSADHTFWECYALTENSRWPLYVFHTRIVVAQTKSSVSSALGLEFDWKNPRTANQMVPAMEQNLIQWIACEIQKRRLKK